MTEDKAVVRMGARGVQPSTMDDAWRLCVAITKSNLAPKSFDTPEKVFVAVQTGAELGLSPMQSLQTLYVVNGAVRSWGDGPLGIVKHSGLFVEDGFDEYFEVDGKRVADVDAVLNDAEKVKHLRAVCQTLRKGASKPVVRHYSVLTAIRAGLWKKGGPWTNDPGRMLTLKARARNLHDNFPDVLMGLRSIEEVDGEEATVVEVTTTTTPEVESPIPDPDEKFLDKLRQHAEPIDAETTELPKSALFGEPEGKPFEPVDVGDAWEGDESSEEA